MRRPHSLFVSPTESRVRSSRLRAQGFTSVELVAVIVLLGLLAFSAIPKMKLVNSTLLTSRDAIVAALSQAQQIAMARDSASNPVTVVVNSNSIDVRENGSSVDSPGAAYPFSFPNGVSVTNGSGTLDYDKLGRPNVGGTWVISLNSGNAEIRLEQSGYAY